MAESKNTFMASKMNKDIDARLIPKGEYRDAVNITVSRSEGEDVGTVQNIKGNIELSAFGLSDKHLEVIGYYVDEQKDLIYFFITNYTDSSTDYLSNFAPTNSAHYIYAYNANTNSVNQLVSGSFLNFSKTHPIGGVDVIEDLLFWTDNRNQPRKININTAISNSSYYTNEDHISVTKYYPFQPISLYKEEVTSIAITDGGTNWDGLTLPYQVPVSGLTGGTGEGLILTITSVQPVNPYAITGVEITNPGVGYTDGDVISMLVKVGQGTTATFTLTVSGISTMKNRSDEYLPPTSAGSANPNPDYDEDWPGDPKFLKEKFVKFSYRFKFDDDEYSLIAPFTQTAFVPRNDGYFLETTYNPSTGAPISNDSDEVYAFNSTINRLMRNKIDEVKLILDVPSGISSWSDTISELKIKEIDILYKEANESVIKVLDTIDSDKISQVSIDKLEYTYQSRKPIRVLPESELIRVYDKSPIRAKTLTAVGNRILYSNFYDKHTSPNTLDYNVNVNDKDSMSSNVLPIEYQNHTLKQNRTYQVGLVLSDRYGRSSDVILSEVDDGVVPGLADTFKGSTVFNPYRTQSSTALNTNTDSWPGDMLEVLFKTQIPSNLDKSGYPGLYSSTNPLGWYSYKIVVKQTEQEYYNAYLPGIVNGAINKDGVSSNTEATISLFSDNINKIPKDISEVGPSQTIYRSNTNLSLRVENTSSSNTQFYPNSNIEKVSQISELSNLGINLNRIALQVTASGGATPPAAIEVGEFNPDVQLGAGVISVFDGITEVIDSSDRAYVKSYYKTGVNTSEIVLSGTTTAVPNDSIITLGAPGVVYNGNNNPLIGILSTSEAIGVAEEDDFRAKLAVAETQPFNSELSIFYETTTSGLISELNADIASGDNTTPYGLSEANYIHFENAGANSIVTQNMNAVNASGVDIIDPDASYSLTSVTDAFGNPINAFELVDNNDGTFFIKTKNNQAPEQLYVGQNIQETTYTFNVNCIVNYINNNFSFVGQLSNIDPAANNIDATWEVTTGTVAVPLYIGSLIDHGDIDLGVSYNGTNFTSDITNGSKILPVSGRTNPQANINQYSELNLNVLRVENFYDQTDYTSLVNPRIIRTKTGDTSLNQINNRDNSSSGLAIEFATPSGISVSELSYLTVHCRLRDGGNLFIDFDFDLIVNT